MRDLPAPPGPMTATRFSFPLQTTLDCYRPVARAGFRWYLRSGVVRLPGLQQVLGGGPVSVGVHLGHIEPRPAPGLEPLPLETSVASRLRTAVGSPGAVAELGRWVLVALPVFLLCAAAEGSFRSTLAPAALFTIGWLLALRSAYRGIHFVFGSAIRAAVGTAVGLVVV